MDFEKLTIKAQEAVQRAQQLAMEQQHQAIECSHLLKGIWMVDEHVLPFIMKKLSINAGHVEAALDQMIAHVLYSTVKEYLLAENALIKRMNAISMQVIGFNGR